ncbi:MAG: tetratricopeptide repeat protein [Janthinobacterium lividum]
MRDNDPNPIAQRRPRIAPPWLVAVLTAAVLVALYLSYPRGQFRGRTTSTAAPSDLSAAYLEAWLRIVPDDVELLSALGTQYLQLGRQDDAARLADRLAATATPEARRQAEHLRLRLAEQQAFAIAPHTPAREIALARLRERLARDAALPWPSDELRALAEEAAAINAPELAAQIYDRLAQQDPTRRLQWYAAVARFGIAAGDYPRAADASFAQQAAATSLDKQRQYFLEGLATLRAGNLEAQALQAVQRHAGALITDRATLVALIQLARAAHRPDLIDRYARALEQADTDRGRAGDGKPVRPHAHRQKLADFMDAPARDSAPGLRLASYDGSDAAPAAQPAPKPVRHARGSAPTDDRDVAALLYQAFLESGDLDGAQRIAQQQTIKDPHFALWYKRLAQVAQWHAQPSLALQSWQRYAQLSGDVTGWQQVLRLAPMLDDDHAYVAALLRVTDPAAPRQHLDAVIAAYERLGEPEAALAFLRAQPDATRDDGIGERLAALAQRAGHYDQALATLRQLLARQPENIADAMQASDLLYRTGDYAGAVAVLVAARAGASRNGSGSAGGSTSDSALTFWQTLRERAGLLGATAWVDDSARHLIGNDRETGDDLAVTASLYADYPVDAGRIAEVQYLRDHSVAALQAAIDDYLRAEWLNRIATLLEQLTPEARTAAEQIPGFLGIRAEYDRQIDQPQSALADLRRAVALPAATSALRAAYLWALVDSGSDAELQAALARFRGESFDTAALWGPYAAAALRLDRPVIALQYLRRQAATRDPLWRLTLADAQERAGAPGQARALRQQVWRDMRATWRDRAHGAGAFPASTDADAQQQDQEMAAGIVLAQTFASADTPRAMVAASEASRRSRPGDPIPIPTETPVCIAARSRLGDAAGLPPLPACPAKSNTGIGRATDQNEVVLDWAVSNESDRFAKRWLARRYAHDAAKPASQQLADALARHDDATVARLLHQQGTLIPLQTRIDAALASGNPALAERYAFDALQGAPANQALQARFTELALDRAASVDTTLGFYKDSTIDAVEHTLSGSLPLSDRYALGVTGIERFQRSLDETTLRAVPAVDRVIALSASQRTPFATSQLAVGRREALNSFYQFAIDETFGANLPVSITLHASRNETATETDSLRIGGMKDDVRAGFSYAVTPRIVASGSIEADRFYSQSRTYLGSGVLSNGEIDYKIRTDYPNTTLRVIAAHGGYGASGQVDGLLSRLFTSGTTSASSVIPETYSQYGVFLGIGTDAEHDATRNWKPFLDVGYAHDTLQGWGPEIQVGIAGQVLGGDRGTLYLTHQRVPSAGTSVTTFGIRYQWFY